MFECRYAGYLIKENIKILNFLVTVIIITLPLPFIIFWPVVNAFMNEGYPRNQMKGILCTMDRFDLTTRDSQANVSDKPKLIVAAVGKSSRILDHVPKKLKI